MLRGFVFFHSLRSLIVLAEERLTTFDPVLLIDPDKTR